MALGKYDGFIIRQDIHYSSPYKKNMNEIFEKYGTDPITLFKEWLEEARTLEPNDPEAVCLASADAQGKPSARMILLKEITDNGFKFHTNEESRKGHDFACNPHVSFCIYWKSTRKQIRVEGTVEQISDAESDTYFTTRPIERQIGAWASHQSQPFEQHQELEDAIEKYTEEFKDTNQIPRPPYWKGYRIHPTTIEFWIGQEARLHTRFAYTMDENENWTATWLCP